MIPGVEGTVMNEPVKSTAEEEANKAISAAQHLVNEAKKLIANQQEQLKIARFRIENLEAENQTLREELNKPLT